MEGLPLKTRQRYLLVLALAFVLVVPLLAFYATGYRLSRDFELIKTGGISVVAPFSGASFYVDDEFKGTGSIFQKNFFIQNLLPGTYAVRIDREGFQDWRKEFEILPTLITSGQAFLLPKDPELVPIDSGLAKATATSSATQAAVTNAEYLSILRFFSATSTGVNVLPLGATTTILYNNASTTVHDEGDIGLWKDKKGLHAWWLGSEDRSPYFFCKINKCSREILVASDSKAIGHFDFLPESNQFVIIEWPDGIYVTELDIRPPQNIQTLYPHPGAMFRVVGGDIFILDGDQLFRVVL